MTKTEINNQILQMAEEEIGKLGLSGKLKMYGCNNTFQRRQRYWKENNICMFKVFLWQLNTLTDEEIRNQLLEKIYSAISYFDL